jgi:hypothetical protein
MAEVIAIQDRLHDPELTARAWDRQPHESSKAFDAFTKYRDAAAGRKLQNVAEELHCSGANVRRWAARWNWYARAREWDIHLNQDLQATQIRERKRMAERQAQDGVLLQNIALLEANKLRNRLENGVLDPRDPEGKRMIKHQLTVNEIAKLYDVGMRAERSARGDPDEDQVARVEFIIETCEPDPDDQEALEEALAAQAAATGVGFQA